MNRFRLLATSIFTVAGLAISSSTSASGMEPSASPGARANPVASSIRITQAKTVTGLYRFRFAGRVSSDLGACEGGRNVALLNKATYADNQYRVVWHGTTTRNGRWATPWIRSEAFPGGYGYPTPIKVVVRQAKTREGGRSVTCRGAQRTYQSLSYTIVD